MKKKTIRIPIYECELTMILDKDLSYIQKKYKTRTLSDYGAVTLKDELRYKHYIVAFTDKSHLSNVAHEIVHIKNFIYIDASMALDMFNDEPEAYLTGWLYQQITDFLNNE